MVGGQLVDYHPPPGFGEHACTNYRSFDRNHAVRGPMNKQDRPTVTVTVTEMATARRLT